MGIAGSIASSIGGGSQDAVSAEAMALLLQDPEGFADKVVKYVDAKKAAEEALRQLNLGQSVEEAARLAQVELEKAHELRGKAEREAQKILEEAGKNAADTLLNAESGAAQLTSEATAEKLQAIRLRQEAEELLSSAREKEAAVKQRLADLQASIEQHSQRVEETNQLQLSCSVLMKRLEQARDSLTEALRDGSA